MLTAPSTLHARIVHAARTVHAARCTLHARLVHTARTHCAHCTHALCTLHARTVHTARTQCAHCTHALCTLHAPIVHTAPTHCAHCTPGYCRVTEPAFIAALATLMWQGLCNHSRWRGGMSPTMGTIQKSCQLPPISADIPGQCHGYLPPVDIRGIDPGYPQISVAVGTILISVA